MSTLRCAQRRCVGPSVHEVFRSSAADMQRLSGGAMPEEALPTEDRTVPMEGCLWSAYDAGYVLSAYDDAVVL